MQKSRTSIISAACQFQITECIKLSFIKGFKLINTNIETSYVALTRVLTYLPV
jgi:hypothetical protein